MQDELKKRAIELLASGAVTRVIGWKRDEMPYDRTPAVFESAEALERDFIYDAFCASNLTKFAFRAQKAGEKTLVFLKPCDSYSMTQLLTEHRIARESLYLIGIPCEGFVDFYKVKEKGAAGILSAESDGTTLSVHTLYGDRKFPLAEVLEERCLVCKSRKHMIYDELIGEEGELLPTSRFDGVERLERMTPDERFAFWRSELSRCIRCNACRNACPACTCESCVFDNPETGIAQKVAADPFEENMYHIIRAFHVAGRCTDCGECSRVCPERIPLHLLNRKFIADIDRLYGDYQAGESVGQRSPLVDFTTHDANPDVLPRGENKKC